MLTKKKLKVLHLLSSSRFSGAENVVFQIINLFKEDCFDMVYSSKDGQIREACEREKISFYPLSKVTIKEVSKVIKKVKPDIIHAHDAKASVIASFFSQNSQIISHIHGNDEKMSKVTIKSVLYLARANTFKHIFWVSKSAIDNYRFKTRLFNKSSVLYNVVDSKKILSKSQIDVNENNFDVVFLGRLTYQKNPERLIAVLKKAIKIKRDLRIAIIGTGDLEDSTKEVVQSSELEKNISFLGFQRNPFKILSGAKVMLMTSISEGTPMCALEAMALGVPIVSTPVDGLVDIVQDNVTGYLSNDDNILSEKIVEIVQNNSEYNRLSRNTLQYFEEVNDLSKFYNAIYNAYIL